jgi:hypothetical protein
MEFLWVVRQDERSLLMPIFDLALRVAHGR